MEKISPKYLMVLVEKVYFALCEEYKTPEEIERYIYKWHEVQMGVGGNCSENFRIYQDSSRKNKSFKDILHGINEELLLKIAVDLGIETPDSIPSVVMFRNEIKLSYPTASSTFEQAFKQIEEHPDIAIISVNSALEGIIKEILKDDRLNISLKGTETLYALAIVILKSLLLPQNPISPNPSIGRKFKTISNSLLAICAGIERVRSEHTSAHSNNHIINDPMYAYFIVNSVATVGLFLKKCYEKQFPPKQIPLIDEIPF